MSPIALGYCQETHRLEPLAVGGNGDQYARMRVWDVNSLAYQAMEQPILNAGTITLGSAVQISNFPTTQQIAGSVTTDKLALLAASGTASASGNTTCLTPASGKKLRLAYLSYNPAAAVLVGWRFGASGAIFLQNNVVAGGIIAKDFGDLRHLEGAVNEPLILNLSDAVSVIWNVLYQEL